MNNQKNNIKYLLSLADCDELFSIVVKNSPSECKLKFSVLLSSIFINLTSFKSELSFFEWTFASSVGRKNKIVSEKIYQLYSNITKLILIVEMKFFEEWFVT